MVHSDSLNYIAQINHIGHAVLEETLRSAALYLVHSNQPISKVREIKEYKDCYLYIQGTGLEIIINEYYLNYNAETIRKGFNYYVRH